MESLKNVFKGFDANDLTTWRLIPLLIVACGLFVGLVILGGWFMLSGVLAEIEFAEKKEATLRASYTRKYVQAANFNAYQNQKSSVEKKLTSLIEQIPEVPEIDGLLADINAIALRRNLKVLLFKPGDAQEDDLSYKMPINLSLEGEYLGLGLFASDLARLSRIVSLVNATITKEQSGNASNRRRGNRSNRLTNDEAPSSKIVMTATLEVYWAKSTVTVADENEGAGKRNRNRPNNRRVKR